MNELGLRRPPQHQSAYRETGAVRRADGDDQRHFRRRPEDFPRLVPAAVRRAAGLHRHTRRLKLAERLELETDLHHSSALQRCMMRLSTRWRQRPATCTHRACSCARRGRQAVAIKLLTCLSQASCDSGVNLSLQVKNQIRLQMHSNNWLDHVGGCRHGASRWAGRGCPAAALRLVRLLEPRPRCASYRP